MKNLIALLSIVLVMYSCGPKVVYEQKEVIKNPWTYSNAVTFEYEISDTLKPYDLQLIVDHDVAFSYENFYISATTTFPDASHTTYPVTLQLADDKSDWLGNCNGNKCEICLDMSVKAYFKKTGKYKLAIEQYSRKDSLEGINALTLKISENQTK